MGKVFVINIELDAILRLAVRKERRREKERGDAGV